MNFKNRTLSCKVDESMVYAIQKASEKEGKSVSSILRDLLFLYVHDLDVQKKSKKISNKIEILELRQRLKYLENENRSI